jgi:hypothetical protein
MAGVELARVAEVVSETAAGGLRGSGYEVIAGSVLTAAHVVATASRVWVRFNADGPDERVVDAAVSMADRRCDLALLTFTPGDSDEWCPPVSYGRLGERAAVVTCMAVGFPRFKLRGDRRPGAGRGAGGAYRDSHQADGRIPSLSSSREGSLEILVAPPERDPDPRHSPWEGMSGAALWCADRIVGLISEHHRREGPSRLSATRVDRWHRQLPAHQIDRLSALSGLPGRASDLADVITATVQDTAGQGSGDLGSTIVAGDGSVICENVPIITRDFTGRDRYGRGRRS